MPNCYKEWIQYKINKTYLYATCTSKGINSLAEHFHNGRLSEAPIPLAKKETLVVSTWRSQGHDRVFQYYKCQGYYLKSLYSSSTNVKAVA